MYKPYYHAPKGAKYLSQIKDFEHIPTNCLFNKGRTGCGGTEMEIKDVSRSTIIAMPTVNLVKDKTINREDDIVVLGVYAGVTDAEIRNYMHAQTV